MQSTSGGFSTPLAQWFFSKGGSVWTASYDDNWNVVHREFTKDDVDFSKTRGSKYVQSYLGDTYTKIQDELKKRTMGLLYWYYLSGLWIEGIFEKRL